jgi:hypothetical protein
MFTKVSTHGGKIEKTNSVSGLPAACLRILNAYYARKIYILHYIIQFKTQTSIIDFRLRRVILHTLSHIDIIL